MAIQNRTAICPYSDTQANLELRNEVLRKGQVVYNLTNDTYKVGDGVSHWTEITKEYKYGENGESSENENSSNSQTGEDTVSFSRNAHVEGGNATAGGKGFKITAVLNNGDGTGTYTLSSVDGLVADGTMYYSVRLATAKYNVGIISKIEGNIITVTNYSDITLQNPDVTDPDTYTVENYLTIVGRPDLGDTDIGFNAHAEGEFTIAQDRDTHAEGRKTMAIGQYGHAEGRETIAAYASHAEGRGTSALGDTSHSEGQNSQALAASAHAEGHQTTASGKHAHAEGRETIASGNMAHAEGIKTTASGANSHSEGDDCEAFGESAHAEGSGTKASYRSHSEGYKTEATGGQCHAEGSETKALKSHSHAEGRLSEAQGECSHAENNATKAVGYGSHSEGNNTIAEGNYSHVEGIGTIATAKASHVEGKYNYKDIENKYVHIVGNGTSDSDTGRSNAYTLDWDGNAWFAGNVETDAVILKSSTEGSTKKFKLTIDDDGTLKATEVTE